MGFAEFVTVVIQQLLIDEEAVNRTIRFEQQEGIACFSVEYVHGVVRVVDLGLQLQRTEHITEQSW